MSLLGQEWARVEVRERGERRGDESIEIKMRLRVHTFNPNYGEQRTVRISWLRHEQQVEILNIEGYASESRKTAPPRYKLDDLTSERLEEIVSAMIERFTQATRPLPDARRTLST